MNIILIYFAIKYKGDWDKIYKALDEKEKVSLKEISDLEKLISEKKWNIITLLDINYPKKLKEAYKPPFVIWFEGNKEILSNSFFCLSGNQTNELISKWIGDFLPEIEKSNNLVSAAYKGVDELIIQNSKNGILFIEASGLDKTKIVLRKDDLVISEYPFESEASTETYRNRNRLIAAFAQSLVLFSSEKNGKINNLVSNFLNLGKEIYCFPGDGTSSDGNSELIKQGANIITSINDIMS